MQRLIPIDDAFPNDPAGTCPSDEDLAAYVDGKLSSEEAKRVSEHLAACKDCFEVYCGVVQYQLEEKADGETETEGKVARFPSRPRSHRPWWYATAAVLLLGIGSGAVYTRLLAAPPTLSTAETAKSIPVSAETPAQFWKGPTNRGTGSEGDLADDLAAFQMGVQVTNLQLLLALNDSENALNDILPRIRQILHDQTAVRPLEDSYEALSAALISQGRFQRNLAGTVTELARESREYFSEEYFDLGQWAEAGRLAALARDPAFFQRRDTRSFLRRLLWRQKLGIGTEEIELEPTVLRSLENISRVLGKGDLDAADYDALVRNYETILKTYYPKS